DLLHGVQRARADVAVHDADGAERERGEAAAGLVGFHDARDASLRANAAPPQAHVAAARHCPRLRALASPCITPSAHPRERAHRAYDALAELCNEALGQALGNVLLGRVVDNFLGLHHLALHVVEVAELVGEPELDGLFAVPEETGEGLRRLLQPRTAAPLDG